MGWWYMGNGYFFACRTKDSKGLYTRNTKLVDLKHNCASWKKGHEISCLGDFLGIIVMWGLYKTYKVQDPYWQTSITLIWNLSTWSWWMDLWNFFCQPNFGSTTRNPRRRPTAEQKDANLREDLDGQNDSLGCGANHHDRRGFWGLLGWFLWPKLLGPRSYHQNLVAKWEKQIPSIHAVYMAFGYL